MLAPIFPTASPVHTFAPHLPPQLASNISFPMASPFGDDDLSLPSQDTPPSAAAGGTIQEGSGPGGETPGPSPSLPSLPPLDARLDLPPPLSSDRRRSLLKLPSIPPGGLSIYKNVTLLPVARVPRLLTTAPSPVQWHKNGNRRLLGHVSGEVTPRLRNRRLDGSETNASLLPEGPPSSEMHSDDVGGVLASVFDAVVGAESGRPAAELDLGLQRDLFAVKPLKGTLNLRGGWISTAM